ncbi:hypothetical protein D1872_285590 [compost metagenome]
MEIISDAMEWMFVYLESKIPDPPKAVIAEAEMIGLRKSTDKKSNAASNQPPSKSPNKVLTNVNRAPPTKQLQNNSSKTILLSQLRDNTCQK